jgi:hypothetical protein
MGMPTRKTMVVPCMVNSRLKTSGDTTVLSATASWSRMSEASRPATTRKTIPEVTYMMPSRL